MGMSNEVTNIELPQELKKAIVVLWM